MEIYKQMQNHILYKCTWNLHQEWPYYVPKSKLTKCQKKNPRNYTNMFLNFNSIKIEISNRMISGKSPKIQNLNNTLWTDTWNKEEFSRENNVLNI